MKLISNITTIAFALFVLSVSVGIPIANHIHSSNQSVDYKISTQQGMSCDQRSEEQSCCQLEAVEPSCCSNQKEVNSCLPKTTSNCHCNPSLGKCCCCFLEIEYIVFSFDAPPYISIEIPAFLEAFSVKLTGFSNQFSNSIYSLSRINIPPLIPYSQQLAVFQNFRL